MSFYIAPTATVVGDVTFGDDVSVWYGAAIRGDFHAIRIGTGSNIQDTCVLHAGFGGKGIQIGAHVSVGHGAVLHSCAVGDRTLIGIGAIVLDDAVIGADCIVAAGALVSPGKQLEAGFLYRGSPATAVRALTQQEREGLAANAQRYIVLAKEHSAGRYPEMSRQRWLCVVTGCSLPSAQERGRPESPSIIESLDRERSALC